MRGFATLNAFSSVDGWLYKFGNNPYGESLTIWYVLSHVHEVFLIWSLFCREANISVKLYSVPINIPILMHLIRSGTTLIWDYVLGPCDGLKSPVEVGNRFHCSLNNPKAAFGAGFPFSIALERPVSGPIELRICTDQVHKLLQIPEEISQRPFHFNILYFQTSFWHVVIKLSNSPSVATQFESHNLLPFVSLSNINTLM